MLQFYFPVLTTTLSTSHLRDYMWLLIAVNAITCGCMYSLIGHWERRIVTNGTKDYVVLKPWIKSLMCLSKMQRSPKAPVSRWMYQYFTHWLLPLTILEFAWLVLTIIFVLVPIYTHRVTENLRTIASYLDWSGILLCYLISRRPSTS